jgi:hypothetical protein
MVECGAFCVRLCGVLHGGVDGREYIEAHIYCIQLGMQSSYGECCTHCRAWFLHYLCGANELWLVLVGNHNGHIPSIAWLPGNHAGMPAL